MSDQYDYIIAGGGTCGCVIASRLLHAGYSVALFETGPENYSDEIMSSSGAPLLHGTTAEYNYKSTPQTALGNREIPNYGGKILSGSSGVNYGLWTRGDSADYDAWAKHVGDDRWSYANMLQYFKKTEKCQSKDFRTPYMGYGDKGYPLKDNVLQALQQSGLKVKLDGNDGDPLGISQFVENWKDNRRQPASLAYDLSKARVYTNTTVSRIEFDTDTMTATGITWQDGHFIKACKEVIVCCGAIRTPQLLMLSGIGPKEHLNSLGISTIIELPVGKNLHDHVAVSLLWKLRHPEQGLALGSPLFNKPSFFAGTASDWISVLDVPNSLIMMAAADDEIHLEEVYGPGPRAQIEILTVYAPIAGGGVEHRVPFDGTHISTPTLLLLPTSRGEVTLASKDVVDDPIVNPKYLSTEVDRALLREGIRASIRAMETPAGRELVVSETPPPGYPQLTIKSTDEEIGTRIALGASSFYQNAGTAAMGTVVDSQSGVKGIQRLRVCDASILPLPLACHYQAPMYAIAEAFAVMILEEF